jgi:hypothetical protein
MATATGDGPIVFFTAQGQQVSYPLSEIEFDGGTPRTKTPPATADAEALSAWLAFLAKEGRIAPTPVEPPGNAMLVTATEPGSAGNRITVTVASTAQSDKVNITITELDVYAGVSLGTLAAQLGTSTAAGARPGLVRVKTVGTLDPVEGAAAAVTSTPPSWDVPSATTGTPSFTLEARRTGTDPARVTITVTDLDGPTGNKTFTLKVTWTLETLNVTVASLAALATAAAFAVEITPIAPATSFTKLPKPGTVTLSGGAEVTAAKPASATILAS